MKILQPHKISTEILDLIYEAKQYLIIVSPYVNFQHWARIANELENARKRGIRIDFFVRNEPENVKSWEEVESLGINARLINNLHAKFYFNETNGVISSMNLLSSSNSNSIEIGCKLDSQEELEELKRFVRDFIIPNEVKEKPDADDLYLSKEKFAVALENYIANDANGQARVYFKNGCFNINACSNQFTLAIDKVENKVYLSGIISQDEAVFFSSASSEFFKSGYLEYELLNGSGGYHNMIGAWTKNRLSNAFLDKLRVNEKKMLIPEISGFIKDVRAFKDACYAARK
ncbi:phospholipase D-like domain-containing protein [Nafulsella turpanensis]|uniref:phospholipase D-like domain-containing protein n=1 Tax=Nafulsella turpanensis TaxID=1265690 RepID=UPI0003754548|nr:phospholipase D-like domain-containing protein [Nafulsella turpanensis]